MSPLQWLRWRIGTYRAAYGTIKHVRSTRVFPETLVDCGARNSEFMRSLSLYWPWAQVHSFEMSKNCKPIGQRHIMRLGDKPGSRLSEFSFNRPALLKVDCDGDTEAVLRGADLYQFDWLVVEVMEDGFAGLPNNRGAIEDLARAGGFRYSKAVDATVCLRTWRVAQTDVLFWR